MWRGKSSYAIRTSGASGGGRGLKTVILSVYRFIASQAPTPKSGKRTCNH